MPEISRFFGIVISMHYVDHEPPHFHARYGEHEAAVAIESLGIVRGQLPRKVGDLLTDQQVMVYANSRTLSADQYVWWKHDDGRKLGSAGEKIIGGWSAERKLDDATVKLMEPVATEPLRPEFKTNKPGQMLYPWQDVNAPPLAELQPDVVFTVDPDSRQEKDGIIWWQVLAWVVERDKDNVFLDKIIAPTEFLNAKIPMRVVNTGGLWVRGEPKISTPNTANVIGELDFQQVLQVYEHSTMVDQEFLAWNKKAEMSFDPVFGSELDNLVRNIQNFYKGKEKILREYLVEKKG